MSKAYELVVFGATGFTGRLAAQYITKQYPKLKWAVAGRSKARLEEVAQECGGKPGVVVADAQDDKALLALAQSTKVVVACAGPFSQYGSKLVAACVQAGSDYCDITGEIPWVREMIAEHDDAARKSGARIVHLCGHDSVPWDLSTLKLAEKLKEQGEELARVDFYDDIKSAPSGGTLATALGLMFGGVGKKGPHSKALGYDALTKDGSAASKHAVKNRSVAQLDFKGDRPRAMFFMAGVNAACVKRSNALNKYGENFTYCEGYSSGGLAGVLSWFLYWVCFGLLMYFPPTRALLTQFVLPKPGEGPSAAQMEAGYLTLTGVAKGSKGSKVKSTMHFKVDPGYKDTARMVVESGLALTSGKVASPGGVFTPACCQGQVLLDRLTTTGTTFELH